MSSEPNLVMRQRRHRAPKNNPTICSGTSSTRTVQWISVRNRSSIGWVGQSYQRLDSRRVIDLPHVIRVGLCTIHTHNQIVYSMRCVAVLVGRNRRRHRRWRCRWFRTTCWRSPENWFTLTIPRIIRSEKILTRSKTLDALWTRVQHRNLRGDDSPAQPANASFCTHIDVYVWAVGIRDVSDTAHNAHTDTRSDTHARMNEARYFSVPRTFECQTGSFVQTFIRNYLMNDDHWHSFLVPVCERLSFL